MCFHTVICTKYHAVAPQTASYLFPDTISRLRPRRYAVKILNRRFSTQIVLEPYLINLLVSLSVLFLHTFSVLGRILGEAGGEVVRNLVFRRSRIATENARDAGQFRWRHLAWAGSSNGIGTGSRWGGVQRQQPLESQQRGRTHSGARYEKCRETTIITAITSPGANKRKTRAKCGPDETDPPI